LQPRIPEIKASFRSQALVLEGVPEEESGAVAWRLN
jgi:hypothetical protein